MSYVKDLLKRYPALSSLEDRLDLCIDSLVKCYNNGGKILIAGNGGSCADAEHISGELLKGFLLDRPPLFDELKAFRAQGLPSDGLMLQRGIPAIPLASLCSSLTAFSNDVSADMAFAQLVYALGKSKDVLICLSTSGNSSNVLNAARTARALGISTIALTGKGGGRLAQICDVTLDVPEVETYKVQELHLPLYHAICAELERKLFGNDFE